MDSETNSALQNALRCLAHRDYGEQELYQKLLGRHAPEAAAAAMGELAALNLLDDGRFAANKALSLARRGKSDYIIRCELGRLGLRDENIAGALAALDTDDRDRALSVLRKSYLEKLRAGKEENVMAALSRRGFRACDIRAAVGQVKRELTEEAS